MIEHRRGQRVSVEVAIGVNLPGRPLLRARSRDISTRGIFIVLPVEALALHMRVELALAFRDGEVTRIRRVTAMVVRLSDDGAGLMFAARSARVIGELMTACRVNGLPPAAPEITRAAARPTEPTREATAPERATRRPRAGNDERDLRTRHNTKGYRSRDE